MNILKKLLLGAFLFCGIAAPSFAQQGYRSFSTSSVAADNGYITIGSGIAYHLLTWTVTGTVATCTVSLDSSTNGSTWSTGGVISGQTCTSNGQSSITNAVANYVRINVSTLSGGGTVTVVWDGYVTNPGGGSGASSVGLALPSSLFTVSGSPVTTSGTLTGAFITNFAANEVFGNCTGSAATPGACYLGSLFDTNGNSVVTSTATSTAVDFVNITNAATTGTPTILSAGSDSTVALEIGNKGATGTITFSAAGGMTENVASGQTTTFEVNASNELVISAGSIAIPNGNKIQGASATASYTVQNGQDGNDNGAFGTLTVRGAAETGAGGSSTVAGQVLVEGGTNTATNTASLGGGVELLPGVSTGSTQGLQGLPLIDAAFVKGTTVTQWNIECFTSAMTVGDCGASPTGTVVGVAEVVNTNTVQVAIGGVVPINSSNTATVGHTFCAGSTAGDGTDSGGTTACTVGTGLGIVAATSGAYKYPDGTSFTATTTLPLIRLIQY